MTGQVDELNALNEMAYQSIAELNNGKSQSKQGDFWKKSDPAKQFRPSQQSVSVPLFSTNAPFTGVQRTFYRGSGNNEYSTSPDSFYRKLLHTVYKNPPDQEEEKVVIREESIPINNLNEITLVKPVFAMTASPAQQDNDYSPLPQSPQNYYPQAQQRVITISPYTRNQYTAMILSSVAKMLTVAVLGWARDKSVPFEYLQ